MIQSALRNGRFAKQTKEHETEPFIDIQSTASPTKKLMLPALENSITSAPKASKKLTKVVTKGYGRSGCIQSRTCITSLLFKRWSDSYWLHVYPVTINIFESKEKMEQWKTMNDHDDSDGKKNVAAKKKLVRLSIDFDTEGWLQKKINAYMEANSTSLPVTTNKSKVFDEVKIGIPAKYIMEEVRSKYYTRKGPLM